MSKTPLKDRRAAAAAKLASKPPTSHMHLYTKLDEINAAREAVGLKPLQASWQRDGRHIYGPNSQVPIDYLPDPQARLVIQLPNDQVKAEHDAAYLEALAARIERGLVQANPRASMPPEFKKLIRQKKALDLSGLILPGSLPQPSPPVVGAFANSQDDDGDYRTVILWMAKLDEGFVNGSSEAYGNEPQVIDVENERHLDRGPPKDFAAALSAYEKACKMYEVSFPLNQGA